MQRRPLIPWIVLCLAVPVIAYGSFLSGLRWNTSSRKAIAENHAIWLARYWEKGASVDTMCATINRDQNENILTEEWSLGNDEEVIRGPIINGQRIFIEKNKSVLWRTAK